MDDPFVPRDSSSSPDTIPHPISDLNNFILPPIRPARPHPVIDFGHIATLRDVENAFRHADVALRQAREALRNDAIMSGRFASAGTVHTGNNNSNRRNGNGDAGDIVDLTTISSDTSNEDPEVQWSATRHPNDSEPITYGRLSRLSSRPLTRAVPSGSGIGVAGSLAHIRPYPHYIHPPPIPNHRAEESAIRRQRQARRDWERVERRNRERAAEIAQRDAVEQARRQAHQAPLDEGVDDSTANDTRTRRYSSDSTTSSISLLSNDSLNSEDTNLTTHQNTQNTSNPSDSMNNTMASTRSMDLTRSGDQSNLEDKILSQQQQSAIAAQKSPTSTSKDPTSAKPHATPLSTYRCAICMDTPTTATTTICGHVFCHTCLKDSLKWSAQQRRDDAGLHGRRAPNPGTGLCPVCRKVLPDKEGGPKPGIVGLEIRTISRKEWEKRKTQEKIDEERDNFLRSLSEKNADLDKGKEKEKETTEYVKTEDQSESPGFESLRQAKARFTRKRRRDELGEHPDYHDYERF